ncbi:DEAD-box ATP-dependent RNA helicase 5 [Aristolochia californica]|uniref:DEAD-box ATP-dependent RNA helicase 5 n=1 Tax=Aristolochia californica TaxID=171875 RepID=UPI0035E21B1B
MGRELEQAMLFGESEALRRSEEKLKKREKMKKDKKNNSEVSEIQVGFGSEVKNGGDDEKEPRRKRKVDETEILRSEEDSGHEGDNGKEKKKKKNKGRSKVPPSSEEFDISNGNGNQTVCSAGGIVEEVEKKTKKDKKNKRLVSDEFEPNCSNGNKTVEALDYAMISVENGEKEKKKGETDSEAIEAKGVIVSGNDTKESKYDALKSFAESGLPAEVLECCKNFSKPSPIQSHAWPFLLNGRDFIGIAATGSGKTLAFGVPALMHILGKKIGNRLKGANPMCLVLSPTRELAQQIADVLSVAGGFCGVKTVCVYGGTSKGPQISSLKSGVDIVIGTPGRLKDLIGMGICRLKEVSFVVLDEADRMLDMGFEAEVRSILSQTSLSRQMVMFSATWPLAVHQLAQEFMDPNPVKVVVGSEDLAANHDVMQIVEVLDDRSRNDRLIALLEKYHKSQRNRVLVFVLYKKEAARVETMLQNKGWKVVSVHGDKSQHDRTKALSLFKEGKCPLMIATDVASRGLDIPDVEVVINYSFPLTTEDYVHRIGRTGRAGKKGVAHTFFMHENKGLAGELVNVLREAGQIVPTALTKFGTHVKKKESKLYGAHFKEIAADAPKSTKITFNTSDDED